MMNFYLTFSKFFLSRARCADAPAGSVPLHQPIPGMRQQMMPRAKRLELARIVAASRGEAFFMVQIYRPPVAIGHAAATAVLLPQNASDFYGDISGDWFAGCRYLACRCLSRHLTAVIYLLLRALSYFAYRPPLPSSPLAADLLHRQFVFFLRDFPPPPLQRATQKDIDVDAFGL